MAIRNDLPKELNIVMRGMTAEIEHVNKPLGDTHDDGVLHAFIKTGWDQLFHELADVVLPRPEPARAGSSGCSSSRSSSPREPACPCQSYRRAWQRLSFQDQKLMGRIFFEVIEARVRLKVLESIAKALPVWQSKVVTEAVAERERNEVLLLSRELAGAEHLRDIWPSLRTFLLGEGQRSE